MLMGSQCSGSVCTVLSHAARAGFSGDRPPVIEAGGADEPVATRSGRWQAAVMKLYTYYRSSAAYRVRIVLNIKGLAYESVSRHLRKDEHRTAEFFELNPQGLVPALEDGERIYSQSLAIIEYLDEKHPEPPLLPESVGDRAVVRALALAVACEVHPLNNLRVLNFLRKPLGLDEAAVNTWYQHWIAEGFRALEEEARRASKDGRHMFGRNVTLADVCVVPQMYNAVRFKCDLTPYPTLCGICGYLQTLPEFANAAPEAQPDAE
jgi:maleylacetoacetate isomerase